MVHTIDFYKKQLAKVGQKIREARLEMKWTQQDLAKRIGVSDKTVSALEIGRVEPSISQIQSIASVTEKPIGFFTSEKISLIEAKFDALTRELEEIKGSFKNE